MNQNQDNAVNESFNNIITEFNKFDSKQKHLLLEKLQPPYKMEVTLWYQEDCATKKQVAHAFTVDEYYDNIKSFLLENASMVMHSHFNKRKKKYENIPTLNIIDKSTIDDFENLIEIFDCMKDNKILTVWNSDNNDPYHVYKVWHVDSAIKHLRKKKKCKKEVCSHMLLKV